MNSRSNLNSLFSKPDRDIPSGIVVFLVALPLCLGIALASGAPLITGLISGIIGGIVIGSISNSATSVSGPAASLSAVVLVTLQQLGSFEIFLTALVIGGFIQLGFGILKAGLIADYMPTSIIKGLLAAIGIILIISQIPYALGVELDSKLLDYSQNFINEAPERVLLIIKSFSPGAIILSTLSLSLLIFWEKTFLRKIKLLPPSLFVVILGVLLNIFFKYFIPNLYLDSIHLVNIPNVEKPASILTFPDFSAITNFQVWTSALTIAIIASIATLLNLEATDNLDPHKRRSSPNRELVAQGIGNTIAGLIGGIPITSVIVRSSVNIETGAETKLSTLVHGVLLLASVLFLSPIINMIPLASLAAILLVVGYKLASISVFKNMYKRGWSQFIPFVITTLAINFTDVLTGVLIGSAFSVFFLLRSNYYNPFYLETKKSSNGNSIHLELSNEVSFLNKPAIKKTLYNLPKESKITIDASFSTYVEPDIIEILEDFQNTYAKENDINFQVTGLRKSYKHGEKEKLVSGKINSGKNLSTPQQILDYLKEGNKRYINGELVSRRYRNKELMDFIKDSPLVTTVNCIDMREPLNMLLNTGIGDLIPLRVAGNLVDSTIIHNIETACRKQGCRLILIIGNSQNSLIKEAVEHHVDRKYSYLSRLIVPAITSEQFSPSTFDTTNINNLADKIILWNLEESKHKIIQQSEFINKAVLKEEIGICSAFFDRTSGDIKFSSLLVPLPNPKAN